MRKGRILLAVVLAMGWILPGNTQPYVRIAEANKVGLASADGEVMIPPAYEELGWSEDTEAWVSDGCIGYRQNGYWGLISTRNKALTPAKYFTLSPIKTGRFLASQRAQDLRGSAFGILDSEGNIVVPFRYFSLRSYHEYLIARRWVDNELRYGLLKEEEGENVLPFTYRNITPLDDTLLSITNEGGKTALYHINQSWVTGFNFDRVSAFEGNYARVYEAGKVGLINRNGAVVVPPKYKSLTFVDAHSVEATYFPTWRTFTSQRDTIHEFAADTVVAVAEHSYQLAVGDADLLWNDSTGIFYLPGYHTKLAPFEQGIATFTLDGQKGALNTYSQTVVPPKYDTILRAGDYLFAARHFRDSMAWDIWDEVGIRVNEIPVRQVLPLREGYFPVQRYGKWGFMSPKGELVLDCIYDTIPQPFRFGYAIVSFHGHQGIINTEGEWVQIPEASTRFSILTPSLYLRQKGRLSEVRYLSDQRLFFRGTGKLASRIDGFLVEEEGKFGLKNYAGEWFVEPQYDSLSEPIAEQFYGYRQGNNFGILTLDGKPALNGLDGFESLYAVSEGFFPVKISGRFGFVDNLGRLRVANRYDSVAAYSEERAAIMLRGRWGAIDVLERIKIQPLYDAPFFFQKGRAVVQKGSQYGIIDLEGKQILPIGYDDILPLPSGRFLVRQGDYFGMLDADGYEILQTQYEQLIEVTGQETIIVKKRNQYGLLNPSGRDLLPSLFAAMVFDPYNTVYLTKMPGKTETLTLQAELKNP